MSNQIDDKNSIEYWKSKYEDLNEQFDDFQRQSYDLEKELECQIKLDEEKIKDLENKNSRLMTEIDNIKNKYNEISSTTHKQISQLQEEFSKVKAHKEEMHKYIRELEQKNDDLERTNRCAMFSLGDFESKLNDALERNAILESEVEEKNRLAETVQRLRDEARDLKQELAVTTKQRTASIRAAAAAASYPSTPYEPSNEGKSFSLVDNASNMSFEMTTNHLTNEANSITNTNDNNNHLPSSTVSSPSASNHTTTAAIFTNNSTTPQNYQPSQQQQQPQKSLSTSLRISALNYVGDALRKVTSMESRLVASRNFIKENTRERRVSNLPSVDSR